MASEILLIRLMTGEDVIGRITKNEKTITVEKGFVLIPTQQAPGQPVKIMMTPYAPYTEGDKIDVQNGMPTSTRVVQQTSLFPVIPSISYKFKF